MTLPQWLSVWLTSFGLLLAALVFSPVSRASEEFLDPEQAFQLSAAMADPTELVVHFRVAPGYYMYREQFRFDLSPDAKLLGEPVLPPGKIKYDPTFDKNMEVYYEQVTIRLPVRIDTDAGARQLQTLEVTSQGCADAGLCYAPISTELQLVPTMAGYDVVGPGAGPIGQLGAAASAGFGQGFGLAAMLSIGDLQVADQLAQSGLIKIVLVCLLLGLLLSFTPCVLPMVPILLTLIAGDVRTRATAPADGQAVASDGAGSGPSHGVRAGPRRRGLGLALLYVLGMSLVYTALGVAAGLLGASLAVWLQTPWLLAVFAVLLAVLALAMFDVFTFQAPTAMQSALNARLARIPGGRHSGAFLMGMLSALIVGPCVAAPLAGVLLFISQTGDILLGGLALFALAWGQGILLLVVGASSGALLPRAGAWMERVKHVFGVLLLATAWWMLIPVLPPVVLALGWAVLACWAAILFGAMRPLPAGAGPWHMLARAAGYLLALWGAAIVVGLAAGGRDVLRPLAVFSQGPSASWSVPPPSADAASAAPDGAAGAAFSMSPAAAGGQPGFQAGASSHPPFTRIRSQAELDRILASSDRPVMLDFYADWCVSCIEMERFTFSEPGVANKLARFTLLQVDVTGNSPEDRALLKRFRLFGPPGIIFFDPQGQPLSSARVVGFQNAQRFSAVLDGVLNAWP